MNIYMGIVFYPHPWAKAKKFLSISILLNKFSDGTLATFVHISKAKFGLTSHIYINDV